MAVSFPQNPSEGDTFTSGNSTFAFTNGKWVSATAPDSLVSKSGDTMTGLLTLSGSPVSDSQAASKLYVDNAVESAGAVLVGQIVMWGSSTIPSGWLECNGQSTSGFTALATLYGANVPDLRGQFVRGWDNGRGTDPGLVIKSEQADQNEAHNHSLSDPGHAHGVFDPGHAHGYTAAITSGDSASGNGDSDSFNQSLATNAAGTGIGINAASTGITITNSGGSEARPVNTALMYIIRAI